MFNLRSTEDCDQDKDDDLFKDDLNDQLIDNDLDLNSLIGSTNLDDLDKDLFSTEIGNDDKIDLVNLRSPASDADLNDKNKANKVHRLDHLFESDDDDNQYSFNDQIILESKVSNR